MQRNQGSQEPGLQTSSEVELMETIQDGIAPKNHLLWLQTSSEVELMETKIVDLVAGGVAEGLQTSSEVELMETVSSARSRRSANRYKLLRKLN